MQYNIIKELRNTYLSPDIQILNGGLIMIKALLKEENGADSVELEFKGTTTEVLYEQSLLTLTLLMRLTASVDDATEREAEMLKMLDAISSAVLMHIVMGSYTDEHCKVLKSESVSIDNATIHEMLNRGGDK